MNHTLLEGKLIVVGARRLPIYSYVLKTF
jgi:hypothetical protein